MTGLAGAGLAGFLKAFHGDASETVAHADSATQVLLEHDGVPPERADNGPAATAFNDQRLAWIRRLQALTVSVIKQTLSAEQRVLCSPPAATDPLDVDKL